MIHLIGERPAREGQVLGRNEALTGDSGKRIAKMAGITWNQYLESTVRGNVVPYMSDKWPRAFARDTARGFLGRSDWRKAIVVGVLAADAFEMRSLAPCSWHAVNYERQIAWIYHPSGRNRWYNDIANRRLVETFLQEAFAWVK